MLKVLFIAGVGCTQNIRRQIILMNYNIQVVVYQPKIRLKSLTLEHVGGQMDPPPDVYPNISKTANAIKESFRKFVEEAFVVFCKNNC